MTNATLFLFKFFCMWLMHVATIATCVFSILSFLDCMFMSIVQGSKFKLGIVNQHAKCFDLSHRDAKS